MYFIASFKNIISDSQNLISASFESLQNVSCPEFHHISFESLRRLYGTAT